MIIRGVALTHVLPVYSDVKALMKNNNQHENGCVSHIKQYVFLCFNRVFPITIEMVACDSTNDNDYDDDDVNVQTETRLN